MTDNRKSIKPRTRKAISPIASRHQSRSESPSKPYEGDNESSQSSNSATDTKRPSNKTLFPENRDGSRTSIRGMSTTRSRTHSLQPRKSSHENKTFQHEGDKNPMQSSSLTDNNTLMEDKLPKVISPTSIRCLRRREISSKQHLDDNYPPQPPQSPTEVTQTWNVNRHPEKRDGNLAGSLAKSRASNPQSNRSGSRITREDSHRTSGDNSTHQEGDNGPSQSRSPTDNLKLTELGSRNTISPATTTRHKSKREISPKQCEGDISLSQSLKSTTDSTLAMSIIKSPVKREGSRIGSRERWRFGSRLSLEDSQRSSGDNKSAQQEGDNDPSQPSSPTDNLKLTELGARNTISPTTTTRHKSRREISPKQREGDNSPPHTLKSTTDATLVMSISKSPVKREGSCVGSSERWRFGSRLSLEDSQRSSPETGPILREDENFPSQSRLRTEVGQPSNVNSYPGNRDGSRDGSHTNNRERSETRTGTRRQVSHRSRRESSPAQQEGDKSSSRPRPRSPTPTPAPSSLNSNLGNRDEILVRRRISNIERGRHGSRIPRLIHRRVATPINEASSKKPWMLPIANISDPDILHLEDLNENLVVNLPPWWKRDFHYYLLSIPVGVLTWVFYLYMIHTIISIIGNGIDGIMLLPIASYMFGFILYLIKNAALRFITEDQNS